MAFRKIQTPNLISTETSFDDAVVVINKNNTQNTDVGILARRGTDNYSGFVRDSGDGKFYVIEQVQLNDYTLNDVNPLNITVGKLVADVEVSQNIVLPKGTTVQRPSSPVEGQMWFNTETKMFEGYNGSSWVQLVPSSFVETP